MTSIARRLAPLLLGAAVPLAAAPATDLPGSVPGDPRPGRSIRQIDSITVVGAP